MKQLISVSEGWERHHLENGDTCGGAPATVVLLSLEQVDLDSVAAASILIIVVESVLTSKAASAVTK